MSVPAGTFPDDELIGNFATAEQIANRASDIKQWLEDFRNHCLENGASVSIHPQAVEEINQSYWAAMSESVRVRIIPEVGKSVRADRHKIASLFELLVQHHQPFEHTDSEIATDLNARAAFFVAINIIGNWGYVGAGDLYVSESFSREHLTWLKQLNEHSEGLPIFSNAATWYLVEKLFIERAERAK